MKPEAAANPDEWLVRAARAGDEEAFEHLIRRHARGVSARIALRASIDSHRIEDLTQETLLKAWRQLKTLDDPHRFPAWIFSIADSVAIDAARRDSRLKRSTGQREVSINLDEPHLNGHSRTVKTSPLEAAASDEQQCLAITALQNLPEPYQTPISLRYLGGLEFDEICERLAISRGSLRGLMQRGLSALRDSMGARAAPAKNGEGEQT